MKGETNQVTAGSSLPHRKGTLYKAIGFIARKQGMEKKDFMDYYENHHVPLICRLITPPALYIRRYIDRDADSVLDGDESFPFDVVTELGFADRATFLAWHASLTSPGIHELVIADEEKFMDRSRTQAYAFEEHITFG